MRLIMWMRRLKRNEGVRFRHGRDNFFFVSCSLLCRGCFSWPRTISLPRRESCMLWWYRRYIDTPILYYIYVLLERFSTISEPASERLFYLIFTIFVTLKVHRDTYVLFNALQEGVHVF